jgi:YD repeat-containing protein
MKTKQFIVALLIPIAIGTSCSSDDSVETTETPTESTVRFVKNERVNDNFIISYSYDANNRITSADGMYPNVNFESNFSYDSNNRLTQDIYQELSPIIYDTTQSFSYDSNGLLTGYSSVTENVSISYNGNTVLLSGTIEGDANSQVELQLNSNGLVTKFTENNQYTDLVYDSNGNLTSVKSYDNSNNLLEEFVIAYDDKINPFYGQMTSIYIERFIEWFWEFDGIYFTGIEGYKFPFFKNNIVSISNGTNSMTTYTYTYDNQDYPITVIENTNGNILEYSIEYFE